MMRRLKMWGRETGQPVENVGFIEDGSGEDDEIEDEVEDEMGLRRIGPAQGAEAGEAMQEVRGDGAGA
jgi:hypothetical protein